MTMFRVDGEERLKTTYSAEHYAICVTLDGAFESWYGGRVHASVRGSLKLKEPGQVHRDQKVHAPFTLQGVVLTPRSVAEAAAALGIKGTPSFKAASFEPGTRAAELAFAMHAALDRPDATEIERATHIAELLDEVLCDAPASSPRATRAVRRAREYLHDALATPTKKVTLDELAEHAGLDKFHLIRAFRAEFGLPPYEYLTYLRIARARNLLRRAAAPVAEVAHAVGFYDESQLARHFRRIIGIAPGAYARQHRPMRSRPQEAFSAHG